MVSELKEHKNCCRLCLEHIGHKKSWKITEKIQQKFYKLTNVQLKLSDKYSNRTCKTCAVLLYETSGYQQKLVNIQKKLYGFEDDVELDSMTDMEKVKEMPIVETKIEDFVETFVAVKEERLDESDHSYNYMQDADDRAYSDFEPPQLNDSDSDDYFKPLKKKPDVKPKVIMSHTTATTQRTNRYTDEQLSEAVFAVMNGEMRIYAAAAKFDIPRTTLSHRVKALQAEADDSDDDDGPSTSKGAKKVTPRYTKEQLKNAVHAVIREGMQIMEASRKFDVPRQTLSHRIMRFHERGTMSEDEPKVKVARRSEVSMSSDSTPAKSNRYTEEDIEKAVLAVTSGEMRIFEAANMYNIPRTTLTKRVKKGPPSRRISRTSQSHSSFKEGKAGRGVLGMRRKGILTVDPMFCDLCSFSTFSKNDLVVHMTLGHRFGFTCKKCQKQFSTKEAMKEHRKKMHTEWHCPHCKIDFEERRPWSTHMVRHRREYTCEICGIQVQSHKYKYHVESHSAERVLCTALDCEKIFKTKAGLDYHLNNFHTTPATETCPICGSLYANQLKLKRHMARMHAAPNINCLIPGCSYKSTRKEYVAMHMSKHNDIDEYAKMELVKRFKATRINNNTAKKLQAVKQEENQ